MNILILGQPNVGKSSLFNLLTNDKKNITHSSLGTTRDWHVGNVKNLNGIFVYDTPGIVMKNDKIEILDFEKILKKVKILFYVIDYNSNNHSKDSAALKKLRKFNKKCIIIINKDDNKKNEKDFYFLGFKYVFYISCAHNYGLDKLYDFLEQFIEKPIIKKEHDFSLAIFGKPNAGKSTLLNNILGYKRSFTSPTAGTTSDIVEDDFLYKDISIKILDTAGIYKKTKIDKKTVNYFAIKKSIQSIKSVDMCLLLIDCNEGFDNQTKKILSLLLEKSISILIIMNKIDLINNKNEYLSKIKKQIEKTFSFSKNISLISLSSKNLKNVSKLKDLIYSKFKKINVKISTSKINSWLKLVSNKNVHPLINGKSVNFKYGLQISNKPITLKIFSNFSKEINPSYRTFLINNFCKTFNIQDINVKLFITKSKNPFN